MRPSRTLLVMGLAVACAAPLALARGGYKTNLQHRPRLTFDARDAAHIARARDRIMAQTAPWSDSYASLRDLAETGRVKPNGSTGWCNQGDKWAVLYGDEVHNGLIARAKAAVVWLAAQGVDPAWRPLPKLPGQATSQGWLQQQAGEAKAIIEGMYAKFPGWRGYGVLNRGIVSADSLLVHAQAWDLLAALQAPLAPGGLDRGRALLIGFAEDHSVYAPIVGLEKTNHPIRIASGLGVAGIAFNDHDRHRWWKPGTWFEDPKDWVERAEKTCDADRRGGALHHQAESGAFGEGTAYHAYSEDLYSPFQMAYTRFDGARPLLQSARLDRLHRWSVALRMPDGLRPPVDNAPLTSFRSGYVVNRLPRGSRDAAQRQLMGWDWRDQGYPDARGARALDLLAAYDPSDADAVAIANYAAPAVSRFLRDEGQAVLRTDGGRDAAYALLNAEHGSARSAGAGHEDVDNLSVLLHAERDLLLLDPGYGHWPNVAKTNRPQHHSMVLIDGDGPKPPRQLLGWSARGEDAFVEATSPRTFHAARLQSAEATSEYERARIRRTTTLVAGRALVIEDRVQATRAFLSRAKDHDVTVQLHVTAGGKKRTPATLTPLGLTWLSHGLMVPCEAGVATTRGAATLALGREYDATGGSQSGTDEHAVLRATVRAKEVNVLTLVLWGQPGSAPSRPTALPVRSGATALTGTWSTTTVVAVSAESAGTTLVPATATSPEVETDGTLAIVALQQGQTFAVVAHDATFVRVGALRLTRNGRGSISQ